MPDINIKKIVSNNITLYRKARKLTQKDLAESIGTTNGTISNWEQGVSTVDIESLYKISVVLDVTVNDLFSVVSNLSKEQINSSIDVAIEKINSTLEELKIK